MSLSGSTSDPGTTLVCVSDALRTCTLTVAHHVDTIEPAAVLSKETATM